MRRDVSRKDIPSLGIFICSLLGAVLSLFICVSIVKLLVLTSVLAVCGLLGLVFISSSNVSRFLVYTAIALTVVLRGASSLSRDERTHFSESITDTATVSCRGVVAWKDESFGESSHGRVWLEYVQIRTDTVCLNLQNTRIRLRIPELNSATISVGDVVAFQGILESAASIQSRSVKELCWSLREKHIAEARLSDTLSLVVLHSSGGLRRIVHSAREKIFDTLERFLKPDARVVAGALLLGSRGSFTPEFRHDLQMTGLAHLFALSGLNTGLLVSLLWLVLSCLRIPSKPRYLLLLGILAFYCMLGLGVPSLFRSSLMAGLVIIARLLAKPSHPINLLLFAAAVELFVWPLHVLDAGFHLSYLSMAGILAAYSKLKIPLQNLLRSESSSIRRRISDILAGTFGAQFATAPVAALFFQQVPAIAVLANVVAIPLFSLLIVLTITLLIFASIIPYLAIVLARTIELLVDFLGILVTSSAELVGSSISVILPTYTHFLAIILVIAAVSFALAGRTYWTLVLGLLTLNLFQWAPLLETNDETKVISYGDRYSNLLFVQSAGSTCLIGCGSQWSESRTRDFITNELRKCERNSLDILIIPTRFSKDIGDSEIVIDEFRPGVLVDLGHPVESNSSDELDAVISLSKIPYKRGETGDQWSTGDVNCLVNYVDRSAKGTTWEISISGGKASLRVSNDTIAVRDLEKTLDDTSALVIGFPPAKSMHGIWHFTEAGWQRRDSRSYALMNAFHLPLT